MQDKVVAVNVATGDYYTMNAVASLIWENIAVDKTYDEILELLKSSFETVEPSVLKADLDEQIEFWNAEKLLV